MDCLKCKCFKIYPYKTYVNDDNMFVNYKDKWRSMTSTKKLIDREYKEKM